MIGREDKTVLEIVASKSRERAAQFRVQENILSPTITFGIYALK